MSSWMGEKIISLKTLDPNIEVKDSLNFFQMSLAKLPKTFGIQEMKKGYFPHFFNTRANAHYVGPLPPKNFYGADTMMTDALGEFNKWHDDLTSQNYVFDFQAEIRAYCKSDVNILHRSERETFPQEF